MKRDRVMKISKDIIPRGILGCDMHKKEVIKALLLAIAGLVLGTIISFMLVETF